MRRRLARKELKALKAEARSVSKFKEISYKLENKVVELTQSLQRRTQEKKEIEGKLAELEKQLEALSSRHEEADSRAKNLQAQLNVAQQDIAKKDALLAAKEDLERKLEEAIAKAAEKEEAITKLTNDVLKQAAQLEAQQKAIDSTPVRNPEDSSVILTLKNEVSSLREQLNRANALNSLTARSRPEPSSPTFAPGLRLAEANGMANGNANGAPALSNRGHQRRHSSAGVYSISPIDNRTSQDELMVMAKRSQAANPRAVSVAYNGEDGLPRFRAPNGLADIYDDPAEEKIRLMQDIRHLDEDVLDGLIRGLKIPAPSLNNPSHVKEILFPANLISLVTNEMWKYGLIPESERFLANVMQTIQSHVMASSIHLWSVFFLLIMFFSLSLAKTASFLAFSGSLTSTRCSRSSALPRATCSKVSVLVKKTPYDHSNGQIMNVSSPSSSMTSTVSSTTFTTHGCQRPRNVYRRWSSRLSSRVNPCLASPLQKVVVDCSTGCSTPTVNLRSAWMIF